MNLLVTGVAGFIGTNFVYYFLENHPNDTIIGLDKLTYAGNLSNYENLTEEQNKKFIFQKGDINNRDLVQKLFQEYNFDGVINFAAESHVDRSIHDSQVFLKSNILGTQTLLDIAKQFWFKNDRWIENVKFFQVSTDEVYGTLGPDGYFTEETPLNPRNPYSASKASADLITRAYYSTYNMPINISRCSNNYGPFQFPEKLIPLMIHNALNYKSLPVYGDGKHVRDWVYVEDHCRAIDLIFKHGKVGQVYNIGSNNERENIYIVKKVIDTLQNKTGDLKINHSLIKHVTDRLGHDRRYAIDSSKIQRDIGWKPVKSFDKYLDYTIQWYLDNKNWIKSVISGDYLNFYEKNYKKR